MMSGFCSYQGGVLGWGEGIMGLQVRGSGLDAGFQGLGSSEG